MCNLQYANMCARIRYFRLLLGYALRKIMISMLGGVVVLMGIGSWYTLTHSTRRRGCFQEDGRKRLVVDPTAPSSCSQPPMCGPYSSTTGGLEVGRSRRGRSLPDRVEKKGVGMAARERETDP